MTHGVNKERPDGKQVEQTMDQLEREKKEENY